MSIVVSGYTAQDSDPGLAPLLPFQGISLSDSSLGTYQWSISTTVGLFSYSNAQGLTAGGSSLNGSVETLTFSGTAAQMSAFLENDLQLGQIPGNTNPVVTLATSNGTFSGQVSGSSFSTTVVACFLEGTRISTPSGEIAIEELAIGDSVCTASGAVRQIRWIGHRSYGAAFVCRNPGIAPVRIAAGALADNIPSRDLLISPLHAMAFDVGGETVLVPAESLVNGVSITRVAVEGDISYFHVELSSHEVIFAEGAASESFVDCGSRLMFSNASSHEQDGIGAPAPAWQFCAPRITSGDALARIHARLQARIDLAPAVIAGHVERFERNTLEGWVLDKANPDAPVLLDVVSGSQVVARVVANLYRADLDRAGLAGGRCGFVVNLPVALPEQATPKIVLNRSGVELPVAWSGDAIAA